MPQEGGADMSLPGAEMQKPLEGKILSREKPPEEGTDMSLQGADVMKPHEESQSLVRETQSLTREVQT
jgi:hypothetical protein